MILDSLLHPTPSLRGSSGHSKVVDENQVDLEDGVLPTDVVQMVHEDYWAKFDDLRWVFFREATQVFLLLRLE